MKYRRGILIDYYFDVLMWWVDSTTTSHASFGMGIRKFIVAENINTEKVTFT